MDAQQARRVLDRLVGYNLSPLLWQKVRSRLSAGRVQSVALRMVVDREREIESFVPEEYWTIQAELHPENHPEDNYLARLVKIDEEDPALPDEETTRPYLVDLESAAYAIQKIKRGERRRTRSAVKAPPETAQTVGAFHDQHPAAGCLELAGFYHQKDHGVGAAAL